MTRYYIFDFEIKTTIKSETEPCSIDHYVVVYISNPFRIEFEALFSALKEYLVYNYAPSKLILLSSSLTKDELLEIKERHIRRLTTIPSTLSFNIDDNVFFYYFDQKGLIKNIENDEVVDSSLVSKLKNEGLIKIFRKRQAFIEATETHHFELPSGNHSDKFIRIGNILTTSAEIGFIGFCILHLITDNVVQIYCDTSSIFPVAQAAIILKCSFKRNERGIRFAPPNIDSFGSYEGYKRYIFREQRNSLILISTSRSGTLVKKIVAEKKLSNSLFTILFYLGKDEPLPCGIICNLIYDEDRNPNGFPEMQDPVPSERCSYCRADSIPVRIESEQLMPAKLNIRELTFDKSHAPNWLGQFIHQFHSKVINEEMKSFIRCNYSDSASDKPREFFIDVKAIHEQIESHLFSDEKTIFEKYAKRFKHLLEKELPVTTNRIIYMNDPASEYIATQITNFILKINPETRIGPPIKFTDDEEYLNKIKAINDGSTLVIGSSISTSRKLLNISRSLRNYEKVSITYLIGICRHFNDKAFDTLETNITYGRFGRHTYGFHWVEKIHLPDRIRTKHSPWEEELHFLNELIARINQQDFGKEQFSTKEKETVVRLLDNRTRLLQRSKGLDDNLFWDKITFNDGEPSHCPFVLNKNFAFFDFIYKPNEVPQVDVYFIIASVLHHLRYDSRVKFPIVQNEYTRTLLDPQNFDRYNEGIIQASILRAATLSELHYSISPIKSEEMLSLILSLIKSDSEALIEFILAIALKKLKLKKEHIAVVVKELSKLNTNPLLRYFSLYIEMLYRQDEV